MLQREAAQPMMTSLAPPYSHHARLHPTNEHERADGEGGVL
jgi:hypothetical protein